jgi:hypothetical protein
MEHRRVDGEKGQTMHRMTTHNGKIFSNISAKANTNNKTWRPTTIATCQVS